MGLQRRQQVGCVGVDCEDNYADLPTVHILAGQSHFFARSMSLIQLQLESWKCSTILHESRTNCMHLIFSSNKSNCGVPTGSGSREDSY